MEPITPTNTKNHEDSTSQPNPQNEGSTTGVQDQSQNDHLTHSPIFTQEQEVFSKKGMKKVMI